MKIKNKWLLPCIAVATIGFNTVEGRVPYSVAKAYLPYLLKAFKIENDPDDESSDDSIDNNKIDKEQAILDMIYTDEGQYRMVGLVEKNLFPVKLEIFLTKRMFSTTTKKEEIDVALKENEKIKKALFDTRVGFNVETRKDKCTLGYEILSNPKYAEKLFELMMGSKLSIKKIDEIEEINKKIESTNIEHENEYEEREKKVTELKDIVRNLAISDKDKKMAIVYIQRLYQNADFSNKLGEQTKKINNRNMTILYDFIRNNKFNKKDKIDRDLNECHPEIGAVLKIIYLLNIIDEENELRNIINVVNEFIGGEDITFDEELIKKQLSLKYDEYACRPMSYSYVPSEKLVNSPNDFYKMGEISGDCCENLLRHIITIALRSEDGSNGNKTEILEKLGVVGPQSGIMNYYKHASFRDEVLKPIIEKFCKVCKRENNMKNKPFELNTDENTIYTMLDMIFNSVSWEQLPEKQYSLTERAAISSVSCADIDDYEEMLEDTMNIVCGKKYKGDKMYEKRFTLDFDYKIDGKWGDEFVEKIRKELKDWSGFSYKWVKDILTINDTVLKKIYVIGIKPKEHAEIIRVINDTEYDSYASLLD